MEVLTFCLIKIFKNEQQQQKKKKIRWKLWNGMRKKREHQQLQKKYIAKNSNIPLMTQNSSQSFCSCLSELLLKFSFFIYKNSILLSDGETVLKTLIRWSWETDRVYCKNV